MEFLIICFALSIFIFLISLSKNEVNQYAKYYLFFFFLIFPFVGGYIPEQIFLGVNFTAERIFLFVFLFFLFILFLKNGMNLTYSPIIILFFFYNFYMVLNEIIQAEFVKSAFLNIFLSLGFLVVIENLEYDEADLKKLSVVLSIVAIGTFIVSTWQLFIDPYFYMGIKEGTEEFILQYRISSDLFRYGSIFTGVGQNEGGIAMGFLFVFFLFKNYEKYEIKYLALSGMMLFCVLITFARYVLMMAIMGIIFFLYYRYPRRRWSVYAVISILIVNVIIIYYANISNTLIFDQRVTSVTYLDRTISAGYFFDKFFWQHPIFGYGVSSWDYDLYRVGFPLGIHMGIVDIVFYGGIIGIIIYSLFLLQIHKYSLKVYKLSKNPIFIAYIPIFIAINMTAVFINIDYYGYYFMFAYLIISHKLLYPEISSSNEIIIKSNN